MIVKIKKLNDAAQMPEYQTSNAAGFDFHAVLDKDNKNFRGKGDVAIYEIPDLNKNNINCIGVMDLAIYKTTDYRTMEKDSLVIPPKTQCIVKTGLAFEIPHGYEMQVRPRSGLSFKKQITITNSPGCIDSDYRGEIMIILYNLGNETFIIEEGDRIAQGTICKAPQADFLEVEELGETDRGSGGFGSTGV